MTGSGKSRRALVAAVLALAAAGPSPRLPSAHPAPPQDTVQQKQLRGLNGEIEHLRNAVADLQDRERTVEVTLDELRLKQRLALKEAERLGLDIRASEERKLELWRRCDQLEFSLKGRKEHLALIVRRLYITGRQGYLRALFSIPRPGDVGRAQVYLSQVAQQEMNFINDFKSDLGKLDRQLVEVQKTETTLRRLQSEQRRQAEQAAAAEREHQDILAQIRNKQGLYERALSEKAEARRRLVAIIDEVTRRSSQPDAAGAFARLQGKMFWPCRGTIVAPFGKVRDPNYDVTTENTGIEIKAPLGTEVAAVSSGTVAFCDGVPALGNTIVLGHGNDYYTLYAHLDRFLVSKGDPVAAGQVIGTVGETGSLKGPILHFEIRNKTTPLNPERWLVKNQ